jgi:hypothetical protein
VLGVAPSVGGATPDCAICGLFSPPDLRYV